MLGSGLDISDMIGYKNTSLINESWSSATSISDGTLYINYLFLGVAVTYIAVCTVGAVDVYYTKKLGKFHFYHSPAKAPPLLTSSFYIIYLMFSLQ